MLEDFQTVSEGEFSEVRDYKLAPIWVRQLHTTVLKVPPTRSKEYLATVVARIRYKALRLATSQLPENFSKTRSTIPNSF